MWFWYFSTHHEIDAELDSGVSSKIPPSGYLSNTRLPDSVIPAYRSKNLKSEIEIFHCPQIDTAPIVDSVWKNIIEKFVPDHLVQFLPIKVHARDGIIEKYMWVIPFLRVSCLDIERSRIGSLLSAPDGEMIAFRVRRFISRNNCLQEYHLARDIHAHTFMIVSNELKEALSETGENSMFFSEETINKRLARSIFGG